jgi:hypothetical protein
LTTKNPGDTIKLLIVKNNNRQQITVALAKNCGSLFPLVFYQINPLYKKKFIKAG